MTPQVTQFLRECGLGLAGSVALARFVKITLH